MSNVLIRNHLVHNCWTCATWAMDLETRIAGPDEDAHMHSYQPINKKLWELKVLTWDRNYH